MPLPPRRILQKRRTANGRPYKQNVGAYYRSSETARISIRKWEGQCPSPTKALQFYCSTLTAYQERVNPC